MPTSSIRRPALIALLPVVLGTLACWGPTTPPGIEPDPNGPITISTPAPPAPPDPAARPAAHSPKPDARSDRASAPRSAPIARPAAGSRTPMARPQPSGTADAPPVLPAPVAAPVGTGDAIHVDRAALERDLAGVESVGDVVGLRPHITWKGIDGITVHQLPSDSPIANVGLQEGDVVHSVNGRSLTSIDAAWSLGDVLQTADVLEGEITRDGVRQRVVVHLD